MFWIRRCYKQSIKYDILINSKNKEWIMPCTWKLLKATNVLWWWTSPFIKITGYSSNLVTCSFKQIYCFFTKFSSWAEKDIARMWSYLIQFQKCSSSNLICSLVGLVFSQSHVVTWYWYRCLMLFILKDFLQSF